MVPWHLPTLQAWRQSYSTWTLRRPIQTIFQTLAGCVIPGDAKDRSLGVIRRERIGRRIIQVFETDSASVSNVNKNLDWACTKWHVCIGTWEISSPLRPESNAMGRNVCTTAKLSLSRRSERTRILWPQGRPSLTKICNPPRLKVIEEVPSHCFAEDRWGRQLHFGGILILPQWDDTSR